MVVRWLQMPEVASSKCTADGYCSTFLFKALSNSKKVTFHLDFTAGIFIALLKPPRLSERLESATPSPGKIATPGIELGSMAS